MKSEGRFIPAASRERVVVSPAGEQRRLIRQRGESPEVFSRRCERYRRSCTGRYETPSETAR